MFKTLTRILAASALLAFSPAYAADIPEYQIVPEKSTVKFFAIQNSAPVQGEFKSFNAVIKFSPTLLTKSNIHVVVDTASVAGSNSEIVTNLKLPEWLSVAAFPKAVFNSEKISRMPDSDYYYAEGKLTLRGVTKPATINFQLEEVDATRTIAKGSLTVHRKDYGIGSGEWAKDDVLKDEVRVEFRLVTDKK